MTNYNIDSRDVFIDTMYQKLLTQAQGGMICGKEVDVNNLKELAVACFYIGQEYANKEQTENKSYEHMLSALNKPKNMLGF